LARRLRWQIEEVAGRSKKMADETNREILTAEQAAELLQVSLRTVLQLARDAELRGQKVGRAWRFCRSDVLAYVRGEHMADL
jgi:excisionase family DNA binding protein